MQATQTESGPLRAGFHILRIFIVFIYSDRHCVQSFVWAQLAAQQTVQPFCQPNEFYTEKHIHCRRLCTIPSISNIYKWIFALKINFHLVFFLSVSLFLLVYLCCSSSENEGLHKDESKCNQKNAPVRIAFTIPEAVSLWMTSLLFVWNVFWKFPKATKIENFLIFEFDKRSICVGANILQS